MVSCIADEIRVTEKETVYVCRHDITVKVRPGKFVLETPFSEHEYDVTKKAEHFDESTRIKHTHYYVAPNPTGDTMFTVSHGENIPVTNMGGHPKL
jgi:hypothetical protein